MKHFSDVLTVLVPLIAVIFSWWLATKTANLKYEQQIKKEIYDNYYSDILKACYSLPTTDLLDFMGFYSYFHEDKLSKIITKNFTYVSPEIINDWKKYNLALKLFEYDYENDSNARHILSDFLNYYSHLIIMKSLEESEKLSEELKLPQLSTQLISPINKAAFLQISITVTKISPRVPPARTSSRFITLAHLHS
ncbi:hypothetical protein [Staphylococcus xylosus]|uniref:hypothetical protein n=1 Tax=Staphylococcus xylosus TaxID=1288 RepID=UPI001F54027D|nr:hypothetical protein [Staphylococcus xylosus]